MSSPSNGANSTSSGGLIAILFGLTSALCISTQDLLIKLLSDELQILQIVFTRSVVAVLCAVGWISLFGGWRRHLRSDRPRLAAARVLCNTVAWFCYYMSLPYLSLPVYTAIGFTVFIFAALLSRPVLNEPLSWREWLAAGCGLAGVLLICFPAGGEAAGDAQEGGIHYGAVLLLLAGAFMWALSLAVTRALGASMTAGGILFYSNFVLLLIGAVGAPAAWRAPDGNAWLLMVGVGAFAFLGQTMMISAVQRARIAVVVPTQFTMLLWASLFGWLVWQTLPPQTLLAGAAAIIAGNLLVLTRRVRRGAPPPTAPTAAPGAGR